MGRGAVCAVCGAPLAGPGPHEDWLCARCERVSEAGRVWREARAQERADAAQAHEEIRSAYADGYTETTIAQLMGVDRMTVRRALGKR